eukprot:403350723
MLTCKACKKIYNTTTRQPQVMVCGHSICLQCFQEYEQQEIQIQDEKYQCPIKDSCQQTCLKNCCHLHFRFALRC